MSNDSVGGGGVAKPEGVEEIKNPMVVVIGNEQRVGCLVERCAVGSVHDVGGASCSAGREVGLANDDVGGGGVRLCVGVVEDKNSIASEIRHEERPRDSISRKKIWLQESVHGASGTAGQSKESVRRRSIGKGRCIVELEHANVILFGDPERVVGADCHSQRVVHLVESSAEAAGRKGGGTKHSLGGTSCSTIRTICEPQNSAIGSIGKPTVSIWGNSDLLRSVEKGSVAARC